MVQGPNNPQGPFLYQEDGKTYASLPTEMLQNIQKSPLFDKMQKDCKAEGIEIPQTIMGKDPVAHMLTPQEYLQKVAAGLMPQMDNHQIMKELAEKNDQKDVDTSPDAQKPTATTQDAELSASVPDEQTYIKIPSRYAENSASRRPHPTGAVAPTCRREYGLVNGIPAGYESDDSWDNVSHTHEQTHTHTT